jgi:hypothetical protein
MTRLAKPSDLIVELRQLIDAARAHVAQSANSTLTMLHWKVGQQIRDDVLDNARAGYGEKIVAPLSQELMPFYGRAVEHAREHAAQSLLATGQADAMKQGQEP